MDILKIRRLAGIEIDPLLVEDQLQGSDQVRAKTDRPDKAILNPHRARAALLRQVDHVPRRFATPPCKIIPRSKLQPGSGLRIRDEDQTFRVQSQHRRQVRLLPTPETRSEEHTSELQSLMRISYAVFCLKKKNTT